MARYTAKPMKPVAPVKPVSVPKNFRPVANPPHAPLGGPTSLGGVTPVANPPHAPIAGSEDHPVVHREAAVTSPYPV